MLSRTKLRKWGGRLQSENIFEKSGMRLLLLVLIFVASSALIRFVTSPADPSIAVLKKQHHYDSAQESKFQDLVKSGTQALKNNQYAEALASYKEAENVLPQLNDEEYAALQKAREQIAALYAAAGSVTEAEDTYQTILKSAFRDGAAHLASGQLEIALARYQDAVELSDRLTEGKEGTWLSANQAKVATLRRLQRFPDAIEVTQQMIEHLQASRDEYDPGIIQQYMQLSTTYQMEQDWGHLEQTLVTADSLCDKVIAHYAGQASSDNPAWMVTVEKDQILYSLVDAYYKDGKPTEALTTAQNLYDFIAQHSIPPVDLQPYGRKDVAKYAWLIAAKSNRADIVDIWRERLDHPQQ